MKMKRLSALVLALLLVFCFAACKNNGNGDDESTTNTVGETVAAGTEETNSADNETTSAEDSSESSSQEDSTDVSDTGSEQQNPSNNTTTQKGLNSTNLEEIVKFYKAAAKKTGNIDAKQTMTLVNIKYRPRNKIEEKFVGLFEGIAKAALEKNSTPRTDIPGDEQSLVPSDLISAKAVTNGNYTTITMIVKEQNDNKDTKKSDIGPVGHTVGTLGDITLALNEIPAVKVDYSKGTIDVKYTNAKVVAKIDNNTGKIVSGTWSYTTNVWVENLTASLLGMEFTIVQMGGTIDFVIKTNG